MRCDTDTVLQEDHMQLKQYLANEGISQQALANKIGVSQPTINRWALGVNFPDPIYLHAIEKETNGLVTPRDFVDLWVVEDGQ
jgi:transcriptional regulator with XRE-family HTH domain